MKTRTHFAHRIEMLDAAGAEKPGRSKWGVLCPSPAQANIAQSTDSAASKARSSALASIPAPHSKGAATRLPLSRESMALNRYCPVTPHGRTAGHLSGSDRATRCPTAKGTCLPSIDWRLFFSARIVSSEHHGNRTRQSCHQSSFDVQIFSIRTRVLE